MTYHLRFLSRGKQWKRLGPMGSESQVPLPKGAQTPASCCLGPSFLAITQNTTPEPLTH